MTGRPPGPAHPAGPWLWPAHHQTHSHPWGNAHDHVSSLKALRPPLGRAPPEPWPRRLLRRALSMFGTRMTN